MTPALHDQLRKAGAGACVEPLARFMNGEIGPELALMHGLVHTGDAAALLALLERVNAAFPSGAVDGLLDLARAQQDALAQAGALVRDGLTGTAADGADPVAAMRDRFDAAVARAPEAAVALHSLGSPEILERASAEIATRLREWQLLGPQVDVLDLGCGIGRLARAITQDVRSIVGVDVSTGMIEEAKRRCADIANASFHVGSGRDLEPFEDASFDLVLAVDVFPYLVAAGEAVVQRHMRDIARILRTRGWLLVLKWSGRGDVGRDRADVVQLADEHDLGIARLGTRDFALWDGRAFLLKKRGQK